MNCPTCGGTLSQRSVVRLIISGIGFLAAAVIAVLAIHLMLAMLLGLWFFVMATYFFGWAFRSKGLWCRSCKKFPVFKT